MRHKTVITMLALIGLLLSGVVIEYLFFQKDRFMITDRKWRWMQSKIDGPKTEVDFLIVGSSHIWCGLKPSVLKQVLGPSKTIWNLGRNWAGRDVDYYIIRAVLERHTVKNLVLEVDAGESMGVHYFAPYAIRAGDFFDAAKALVKNLTFKEVISYSEGFKEEVISLMRLWGAIAVRPVARPLKREFSTLTCEDVECRKNDLTDGFCTNDSELKQDPAFVESYGEANPQRITQKEGYNYPRKSRADFYLTKIKEVADQYGVKVNLVHLPVYNSGYLSQSSFDRYSELGRVLLTDLKSFSAKEYWLDAGHLYQKGSEIFSGEVAKALREDRSSSWYYQMYRSPSGKRP